MILIYEQYFNGEASRGEASFLILFDKVIWNVASHTKKNPTIKYIYWSKKYNISI